MKRNPIWHNTHSNFKLNGIHYTFAELPEIGYSLIKEGDEHEVLIGDFLLDWTSQSTTVTVLTSGSTGKPKKIPLKKNHMVNSASATGNHFGLKAGDTALLCLPSSGIAGKMMLVRAMVLGLELEYVSPSSTPLENCRAEYDFAAMVPLQVESSLEQLSQIKTLIIGGAPISKALKEKLTTVSTNCYETYGMTETITHIACKKIGTESANYFETLPDVSVSTDDRNCLVINAPTISDTIVITNDIVKLIDETKFHWLGRFDSVINSGGIKIIPEQLEEKLLQLIKSRFFIAGIPDSKLGQKVVLIVEDISVFKPGLLQKIKRLDCISKYEVPKEIHFLKSFVETESGKIHRKKTLQQIDEVL